MIQPRKLLEGQNSPSPATTAPSAVDLEASDYFGPAFRLTIIALLAALVFMILLSLLATRCCTTADQTAAAGHRQFLTPESTVLGGSHAAVLYGLPLMTYKAEAAKINDCPICLNEFSEGENLKVIPHCGHMFHPSCIGTWLSTHLNCPVCRLQLQIFK